MATITVASFLAAAQSLAKVAPAGALISVPDDFGELQVTDADGHLVGDVNLALALDRWLTAESSWATPPGRDLTGPLSIAQPFPVTRAAFEDLNAWQGTCRCAGLHDPHPRGDPSGCLQR